MATRGDQEFIGAPFHPEERGVDFWPASQRLLGRAPTVISTQARTLSLDWLRGEEGESMQAMQASDNLYSSVAHASRTLRRLWQL
jgi:hypothetical protein